MTSMLSKLELQAEIQDFLFREAEVLDTGQYTTWLADYITRDIEYRVPVQVTRERNAKGTVRQMMHIDDDWNVLELRALRFETEYAWSEDPPTRNRHHVSNVRVTGLTASGEVNATSNLLLYRTRGDKPSFDLISAERQDVLRQDAGGWRLARRNVVLDQTVILTHSLTAIF